MGILKFVFGCVLAVTATSCSAATNAFEEAILSFPNIAAAEFRLDQAVRSANILIKAGQTSACAALLRLAPEKRENPRLLEVSGQE